MSDDTPSGQDADAIYITRTPEELEKRRQEAMKASVLPGQPNKKRFVGDIRRSSGSEVPLWLISFTDVVALMLTFFVLLFSMSHPKEDAWTEMKMALIDQFASFYSEPLFQGRLDFIDLRMTAFQEALDLSYLETLLNTAVTENKSLSDIKLTNQGTHLVLSFPEKLLFSSGDDTITKTGDEAIFALTGVLSGIANRIEIIGHADPTPISGNAKFKSNWELSLSRALSVAGRIRDKGYDRSLRVIGASSGRYGDISDSFSESERKALSRRVDIVLMEDDGRKL